MQKNRNRNFRPSDSFPLIMSHICLFRRDVAQGLTRSLGWNCFRLVNINKVFIDLEVLLLMFNVHFPFSGNPSKTGFPSMRYATNCLRIYTANSCYLHDDEYSYGIVVPD